MPKNTRSGPKSRVKNSKPLRMCMKDVCFYDGRRNTMETLEVSIDRDCPNHGG